MEMTIGVHSIPKGLGGLAIRTITEAYVKPPRVIAPEYPATHAYVAWQHGDDVWYRLDGEGEGASVSLWNGPARPSYPSAHWSLSADILDLKQAHRRVLELVGASYDVIEFCMQVLPDNVRELSRVEKLFPALKAAHICTGVCMEVLRAAGGPAAAFVTSMSDMLPERLGLLLDATARMPSSWCSRVA